MLRKITKHPRAQGGVTVLVLPSPLCGLFARICCRFAAVLSCGEREGGREGARTQKGGLGWWAFLFRFGFRERDWTQKNGCQNGVSRQRGSLGQGRGQGRGKGPLPCSVRLPSLLLFLFLFIMVHHFCYHFYQQDISNC